MKPPRPQGRRFFLVPPGDWNDWLGERGGDHGISVYVFRSHDGARYAAHFDMD